MCPCGNASEVTWSDLLAGGTWGAGETRFFRVHYRDHLGPCGTGANLTNGVQVTFQP
ncbi:MAG: hypothetical protein GY711_28770 [bacterium]|nr:hypothetical protein [bacterium]